VVARHADTSTVADQPTGTSDGASGDESPSLTHDQVAAALLTWIGGTAIVVLVTLGALAASAVTGVARVLLAVVATVSAVACGLLVLGGRSGWISRYRGQAVVTAISALLSVGGGALVAGTGSALQVVALVLAVTVAGAGLPEMRWFASAVGVAWAAGVTGSVGALVAGTASGVAWQDPVVGAVALAAATLVALAARTDRERALASLVAVHRQVDDESVRDQLTGAANRRGLEMVAVPMIENARRQGEAVHCLFIDLDGFRVVNEELGTAQGDQVLSCVAEALRASIRTTDVLARWAGDEFVVIGPGTGTSPLEMERRVRSRLASDPPVPLEVWKGRISVGSATLVPWDDGDLHSLLRRADQDMALRRSLRRHSTLPRRSDPSPGLPPPSGNPVQGKRDKSD